MNHFCVSNFFLPRRRVAKQTIESLYRARRRRDETYHHKMSPVSRQYRYDLNYPRMRVQQYALKGRAQGSSTARSIEIVAN